MYKQEIDAYTGRDNDVQEIKTFTRVSSKLMRHAKFKALTFLSGDKTTASTALEIALNTGLLLNSLRVSLAKWVKQGYLTKIGSLYGSTRYRIRPRGLNWLARMQKTRRNKCRTWESEVRQWHRRARLPYEPMSEEEALKLLVKKKRYKTHEYIPRGKRIMPRTSITGASDVPPAATQGEAADTSVKYRLMTDEERCQLYGVRPGDITSSAEDDRSGLWALFTRIWSRILTTTRVN